MKNHELRLVANRFFILVVFQGFALFSQLGFAQKISLSAGAYNIEAESSASTSSTTVTGARKVSLTRLGSYQLGAQFAVSDPFELGVGYSVFYSQTLGGDMGFGPDISLFYFPLNRGAPSINQAFEGTRISYYETLRPFAAFSFHQRQFQSVQTSYSGYGLSVGSEINWVKGRSLVMQFNYQNLMGPNSYTFQFTDFRLGIQWLMGQK